jgi:hypothetical protein
MTRSELIIWLKAHGYSEDKYGHYQKVASFNGKTYRYKLSSISARFEVKSRIIDHNEWIRIASGYFKDFSVNEKGQLVGLNKR